VSASGSIRMTRWAGIRTSSAVGSGSGRWWMPSLRATILARGRVPVLRRSLSGGLRHATCSARLRKLAPANWRSYWTARNAIRLPAGPRIMTAKAASDAADHRSRTCGPAQPEQFGSSSRRFGFLSRQKR